MIYYWLVFTFIIYTMLQNELQDACCVEEQVWLIQSILNKQDIAEKHLIEMKILALEIYDKLWLSMEFPCNTACEQIPGVVWLHRVIKKEVYNEGELSDVMQILRGINSQL